MLRSKAPARLAALACVAALSLPGFSQTLSVELVENGFASPLFATAPDGDTQRLFVVERSGRIKVIKNGSALGTPYINLDPLTTTSGERGLLGLAFHPDYWNNGLFYVSYTNNSGNSMLVQYSVLGDPLTSDIADDTSAVVIDGPVAQDFSNHNGGCCAFGADDMLYWGLGDGGSADDPFERSQNLSSKLGKMLRYDVSNAPTYVPADNPFVGGSTLDDHTWLYGLRNPWRFSFDRMTGDMYIGDVGQNSGSGREEIDFVAASSTGNENFGWDCKNGSACSGSTDIGCFCAAGSLIDPIHEYITGGEGGSRSITGGFIYRGGDFPGMDGIYFFADYISSRVWSFRYDGVSVTEFTNRTTELSGPIGNIAGFGEDGEGEVYILDFGGSVYKIVELCVTTPSNYCTAVPNSTGQAASMSWSGSTSISQDDATLVCTQLPGGNQAIFFYGSDQQEVPLGNGNLCVGFSSTGFALRLPPLTIDVLGFASQALDYSNPGDPLGQILPGSTWNFAFWFRDPAAGGAFFNFSDGLSVTFCP